MGELDNELIDKVWRDCGAATANMTRKDIFLLGVGVGVGVGVNVAAEIEAGL